MSRSTRERRGESEPEDDQPPVRQFMFIDSTADPAISSEAVRVHAMRHSHRIRREQRGGLRRTRTADEMTILSSENSPFTTEPSTFAPQPQPSIETERTDSNAGLLIAPTVDWVRVIRNGSSNHERTSLQELEGFAAAYLSSVRLLQPDVTRLCRGDALALNAFLALAAFQYTPEGEYFPNIASAQFEASALELLRIRMADQERRTSNVTILAVLMLSQLEKQKGNEESAHFHHNALLNMIRDRGGRQAIQTDSRQLYRILQDLSVVETDSSDSGRSMSEP